MILQEDLDRALSAHGRYIALVLGALETGNCQLTVEQVASETVCDLGHWLAGLADGDRHPVHFPAIQEHHRTFHRETADILTHALAGRREEVLAAMGPGSPFHRSSGDLAKSLEAWKAELHG